MVNRLSLFSSFALLSAGLYLVPTLHTEAAEASKPVAKVANVGALVKYRQNAMEIMGKSNKAIKSVVAGDVAYPEQLVVYAQTLDALAHTIPSLYPEGTGPGAAKTEAKANIWTEQEKWKAANDRMIQETGKLVEVVKGGDMKAIAAQQMAVGKSCGGCHDLFRVEE